MLTRHRVLLLYAASDDNESFSYHWLWPQQFQRHGRFDCTPINLAGRGFDQIRAELRVRRWRGDVVILLHSVFSNACRLSGRLLEAVRRIRAPKVYFIGNEYKAMPEKMAFCERLPVALLISQSASPGIHEIYRARLGCAVTGIPNTGVDPGLFRPTSAMDERPIDLGYRADDSPMYLGHQERRAIADFFRRRAASYGLRVDISLEARDRLATRQWAAFLNSCKGQLGTEAGGDFFELTDASRRAVLALQRESPSIGFEEIWARVFARYPHPVPLRIISGRNIEAAATRTVQVLFEGRYDGYLQPGVHYLALRKDFGNVDEVLGQFRDRSFCDAVTSNAFDLVMSEFTYERLLDRCAAAIEAL